MDERQAIVAWLRREANAPVRELDWRPFAHEGTGHPPPGVGSGFMLAIASMIERGDHTVGVAERRAPTPETRTTGSSE